eukprot:GEZU01020268.1.p1 GENE.GEZU01020268.1~~GEZU01020268.1.p1  ORF type:complete len:307 (+),score=83.03 GEZU01020268.1:72-992(+)
MLIRSANNSSIAAFAGRSIRMIAERAKTANNILAATRNEAISVSVPNSIKLQQREFSLPSSKSSNRISTTINEIPQISVFQTRSTTRFAASRMALKNQPQKVAPAKVKPTVTCMAGIADPYVPYSKLPATVAAAVPRHSLFSYRGLMERKDSFVKKMQFWYMLLSVRKHLPKFNLKQFAKTTATDIYMRLNEYFAKGDKSDLRNLVTESAYSKFKSALRGRDPDENHEWKLREIISSEVVHGMIIQMQGISPFVQITVRIESDQSYAVYNHNGKLIRGDPDAVKRVVDFIVLERLKKQIQILLLHI